MSPGITVSDLGFTWPDGSVLFDGLSFAFGPGRTGLSRIGLIGANGSGKSTLLRLMAGELAPSHGSVEVTGSLGYLPQELTLRADLGVDEALGIAGPYRALRALERGDSSPEVFAAIGDGWDVAERATAALGRLGLGHLGLDRRVGDVSGGEAVLLGLAAQFLRRPGVLLLDEPTNNLDLAARHRLYEAVGGWRGVLVIVSHDRELLGRVDQIADLRDGEVRCYGGNLADYERMVAAGQEAAQRMVRAAETDLRRQRRDLIEARTKVDRRRRYGERMLAIRRVDKLTAGEMKTHAQVSAGKHRIMHEERLRQAEQRLAEAEEAVWEDEEIRVDLPGTVVPAGRTVLALAGLTLRCGARATLEVRGPERIALLGANGAGKTTLLQAITGEVAPVSGTVKTPVPVRYLPQRLDFLDDAASVAGNVAAFAPAASPNAIRARLARFAFRGDRAVRLVGTLSGGERFRAALAALLLAEPPPQLLLLDEPTNSLDLASTRQLAQALAAYRGALIVASHDVPFLHAAGITRWLLLAGELTETEPPAPPVLMPPPAA
jgi:ATPase subunit of ABC transporter with duplicated ATPase domains